MIIFPELGKPFYTQNFGATYLGDSLSLMREITDSSIDLVLTSPPFALTRKKEYGNESAHEYVDWFIPFAQQIMRILKDTGSFIIDLGGAYLPGAPIRSIYQYELVVRLCNDIGFQLAQEFFHFNPSRLPAPAEWVNVRRCRVKDSVNIVWWLCKSDFPKANNRNVLKEYSASMKHLLKNGYKAKNRPSGHDISQNFLIDNGGAVPPNVLGIGVAGEPSNFLTIANTESNSLYLRRCREEGINPHPARFPTFFSDFFIKFLTDEHDVVLDPFAGSNTTGYSAEALHRHWVSIEISDAYLRGSQFRFETIHEQNPFTLIP